MATPRPTKQPTTNLTQVMYFSRLMVIWVLVGVIIILIGKISLDAFNSYLALQQCRNPAPLNRIYNALPPVVFAKQLSSQKPDSYLLRLEGQPLAKNSDSTIIPETPPKLLTQLVYPVEAGSTTLAADQKAREIASAFGFTGDPTQISGDIYRWVQGGAVLQINKRTLKIEFDSNFINNSEYLNRSGKVMPSSSQATKLVKDTLASLNLLPADMATTSAQVNYLKALGNELVPATSINEADFAQVALTRQPIQQATTDDNCQPITKSVPFVEPANMPSSVVAIIARDFLDNDHLVQLDYHYQPIDQDHPGAYRARTLEQAWQVVQSGEAYIANPGRNKQAVVTSYSIGYFEPTDEQPYMQPVYIFHGNDDFAAYVPAIAPSEVDQSWFVKQVSNQADLAIHSTTSAVVATGSAATASPRPSARPIQNETNLNPTASTRSTDLR